MVPHLGISMETLRQLGIVNKLGVINMNRLRFILWLSLVANVLLLLCITWLLSKPLLGSYVASALDMKAGYEHGPILLLLDKEFDKNSSFMLFDKDQGLTISKYDGPSADDVSMKSVSIQIKEDLDLTCIYVPEPKPGFRSFYLTMGDRVLSDLNADGQYDVQYWFSSAKTSNGDRAIDVWYNNEWQEVMSEFGEKSVNTLKNGLKVRFDRTSGRWVPLRL